MLDQNDKDHVFGRLFLALAILMILAVPFVIALVLHTAPDYAVILHSVLPLLFFMVGGFVEVVSYGPLLGTSATYLAHITGNMVNLKVPCAVSARDRYGYANGSKEGEIVSTVAVAGSTIVTTIVIALGVLILSPLAPVLQSPVLSPAFRMSFTALFGSLAYQYFSKHIVLVPLPLLLALALQLAFGVGYTVLIPVSAVASILLAYALYKKGWINE